MALNQVLKSELERALFLAVVWARIPNRSHAPLRMPHVLNGPNGLLGVHVK